MSANPPIDALSSDPRAQRTRAALISAFNKLFLERGYDDIRAAEIAGAAQVGRSTLYEHFDSKDDLLVQSAGFLLKVLARATVQPELDPALVSVVEHFWENRKVARTINRGGAWRAMSLGLTGLIEDELRRNVSAENALPIPLVAGHLAAAQFALLDEWLAGRHRCTPRIFAEALHAGTYAAAQALTAAR